MSERRRSLARGSKGSADADGSANAEEIEKGEGSSTATAGAEEVAKETDGQSSESPRGKALRELFGSCNATFVRQIRPVQRYFPYLKGSKAKALGILNQQMTKQLGVFLTEQFDLVLDEHNMIAKLRKLDAIAHDTANHTTDGSRAWRPSGCPEKDVAAHDTKSLAYYNSLQERLSKLEEENKRLEEDVSCRREVHNKAMERMEQMWEKAEKLENALDSSSLKTINEFLDSSRSNAETVLRRSRRQKRR